MKGLKIFLDSGAFSAFTKGVEIKVEEYIDFIKEHQDVIEVYANLDVIGDAKATLKNQKIMEKAGLKPLPTFHAGEDWKYLKYYIDKYDYIALGGIAVKRNMRNLIPWLDECFNMICNTPDRLPKVKAHGFGLTSLKIMLRYPWYSVDSTSWVLTGRFGQLFVPRRIAKGIYDYTKVPHKICVSTKSPKMKDRSQHFLTASKSIRRTVVEYVEFKGFKMGVSKFKQGKEIIIEKGVSNDYVVRDQLNIMYFLDLEKNYPVWPQPFGANVRKGGFSI